MVLSVDLTLVSALVCAPDVPDPKYPVVGFFRVNGLQPLVRRVRVTTGTNDMQTFVPHPRDLKNAKSAHTLFGHCWTLGQLPKLSAWHKVTLHTCIQGYLHEATVQYTYVTPLGIIGAEPKVQV